MLNQNFFCVKLRTSKIYFTFIILQFILSLATLVLVILDQNHMKNPYVLGVECFLTIAMILDITIKCFSEANFCSKKQNIIDLVVVCMLIVLVVIINLQQLNTQNQFIIFSVQTDQSITLILLIFRYFIQVMRLLLLLKNSHQNIQVQRHTQDIDLKQGAAKTDRTVDVQISTNIGQHMQSTKSLMT